VGPDQSNTVLECQYDFGATAQWGGAQGVAAAERLGSRCGHAQRNKHLCQAPAPQSLKFQSAGPATTVPRRHTPLEKRRACKVQTADASFAYLEDVAKETDRARVLGAERAAWRRPRRGRDSLHNGRAVCSAARSGEEGGRADTQVASWVMDCPPRKSDADM